jgi:WD40 repeat protein
MSFPDTHVIAEHPMDDYLLIESNLVIEGEYYFAILPRIDVWNVETKKLLQTISPPQDERYMYGLTIADIAVSPDGRYFAASYSGNVEDTCGHRTSFVLVWDSTKPEIEPFALWDAEDLAFSPDSRFLVSSEWNSWGPHVPFLHILELASYESQSLNTSPSEDVSWGYVDCFGFDPVSGDLMSLNDGFLRYWDLPLQEIQREIAMETSLKALILNQDGQVISLSAHSLSLWDNVFQNEQILSFQSPFVAAEFLVSGNVISQQ